MARSYKKGIVKDRSSVATRQYNRKVRNANKHNIRHAVSNDLLDDADLSFKTKSIYNDYDYCDYRWFSDSPEYKRK